MASSSGIFWPFERKKRRPKIRLRPRGKKRERREGRKKKEERRLGSLI